MRAAEAWERLLEPPVPLFIHLAASGADGRPFGCRGYAVVTERERGRIWVSVMRRQWRRLHDTARPDAWLAVLLTSGVDNESYQIKGAYCGYRPLAKEDASALERQLEWTERTFPRLSLLHAVSPNDCFAVGVEISAVFGQTPGPQAGVRLPERR
ncbi:hypothetical protein [Paenibacillus cymbidii]|uniref:hypothetical protein n=1 Tax=Paenibacillus cymbidii TaxID=1639034 RepID=UPI001080C500|nr:hypothetical protein [Paenibacillus cymbidii]